ncbi:hypothetical protein SARC_16070, partial [Sphaeroforma arctica JP610]
MRHGDMGVAGAIGWGRRYRGTTMPRTTIVIARANYRRMRRDAFLPLARHRTCGIE